MLSITSTNENDGIKSASGYCNYKTSNSGKLNVNYVEVNGDLYIYKAIILSNLL